MAEFVEAKCYEGRLNEFFQQLASLKKQNQPFAGSYYKETPLPTKLITDLLITIFKRFDKLCSENRTLNRDLREQKEANED